MEKPCCGPARDASTARVSRERNEVLSCNEAQDSTDVVWLAGGRSYSGTDQVLIPGDGEERRNTRVRPFGIDRFAVTNARFERFVEATGHRTEAEIFGWSFVFFDALPEELRSTTQRVSEVPWWHKVDGADWRHPAGPGSTIDDRMDHPVVHVGWTDAAAFAKWARGRLLSEDEWEFAARGGRNTIYPWGDEDPPDDNPRCNNWQGVFPHHNLKTDGYMTTAPVKSFEPNGFGLYNMVGNCWEWCADAFRTRSLSSAGKARDLASRRAAEKVLKGGSYLCHRSYCHRYRIAARMGRPPDTSSAHIGFRIGYDQP